MDVHIEYAIHYNWPPGKDSFSKLHIDSKSVEDGVRAVIMAKQSDDDEAYTFNEFTKGHFTPDEIMAVLSEGAARGRYLTGSIFFVEVYDSDDKCIGRTKIDTSERRPADAGGSSSVHQNYLVTLKDAREG